MGNNLDVMRSRDAKQPLSEWLVSCRLIKSVYINSSAINLFWQSLRSVVVGRLPATWNETDKCYILCAFGKSINKIGGVCRLCHHHHVSVWLSVCLSRPVPSRPSSYESAADSETRSTPIILIIIQRFLSSPPTVCCAARPGEWY